MHSKQTVKYVCEKYPSGNCYYYKQEIITHDCWDNLDSLAWSAPRPITEETFLRQKRNGYKTEINHITKPPAKIYQLHK